ncbi:unnamed protein product [Caenorhabditis auriculariae]|uniref:Peptidase M13 C-terminal domain-containing protein n=1 Tax=Caenorhabditis auriculariae TaxID=2777116 RepID=A0A8S1H6U6_9PELO|nr:unnamed protein product [Caenorhabditis auriculariae]
MRALFQVFFLLTSTVFSHQFEDFVKSHIIQKLNDSVDPCDDFYDHVCPMNIKAEDTAVYLTTVAYKKQLETVTTKFDSFLKELSLENTPRTIVNQLLDICYKTGYGKLLALEFSNVVFPEFPLAPNASCESIAYLFGYQYLQKQKSSTFLTMRNMLFDLPRHLEVFKSSTFRESRANLLELFHDLVEELQEKIENTPWVAYHNGTTAFKEFLSKNLTYFVPDDLLLKEWENYYTETVESYSKENCSLVCLYLEVIPKIFYEIYSKPGNGLIKNGRVFNAFNGGSYMFFTPIAQSLSLIQNKARMLGAIGFIFAHELMHTFYVTEEDEYLAKFWTNSSGCVQKQFEATCKQFVGERCVGGTNETNEEDGADISAIRLIYSHFEKTRSNEEKSDIRGITAPQMFFYSLAATFCENAELRKGRPFDSHAGSKVRTNALVAQMNEFKEAFQCADTSRMARSKTDHCVIYGSEAPGTH